MNGFREKQRQSLASARSVKALIGTSRDSALRSPEYQGVRLWRPVVDDQFAIVNSDDDLTIAANVYLDARRVSSYLEHSNLLARHRAGWL